MALLDRFFVSDEIEDKFPICRVNGLPYTYSDHCPIILSCEYHKVITNNFKFEKMWLLETSFVNLVICKWNSLSFHNFKNKRIK